MAGKIFTSEMISLYRNRRPREWRKFALFLLVLEDFLEVFPSTQGRQRANLVAKAYHEEFHFFGFYNLIFLCRESKAWLL